MRARTHTCARAVATSILADVSFGISQMKLNVPSALRSGMSCHAEMSAPLDCRKTRNSSDARVPYCVF